MRGVKDSLILVVHLGCLRDVEHRQQCSPTGVRGTLWTVSCLTRTAIDPYRGCSPNGCISTHIENKLETVTNLLRRVSCNEIVCEFKIRDYPPSL